MKPNAVIMGVGMSTDKAVLGTHRYILELPESFNEKIHDLFFQEFPTNKDWQQFIVKKTDYNYKEIK